MAYFTEVRVVSLIGCYLRAKIHDTTRKIKAGFSVLGQLKGCAY